MRGVLEEKSAVKNGDVLGAAEKRICTNLLLVRPWPSIHFYCPHTSFLTLRCGSSKYCWRIFEELFLWTRVGENARNQSESTLGTPLVQFISNLMHKRGGCI